MNRGLDGDRLYRRGRPSPASGGVRLRRAPSSPSGRDVEADVDRDRFWSHVAKAGADDCWNWTGWCQAKGYGMIRDGTTQLHLKAHRVSFLLAYGWLPLVVMHTCDNPPCVNPLHLRGGTVGDNTRDMVAKGRGGMARLTPAEVREIRELLTVSRPSIAALARRYGVAKSTMGDVVHGRTWPHIAALVAVSSPSTARVEADDCTVGWLAKTRVRAFDGRVGTVVGEPGMYRWPEVRWDDGEISLIDGAGLCRAADDWLPRAIASGERM